VRGVQSPIRAAITRTVVRDLDIAEVAQRSGVPASALRFYERKGLIASVGRRGLRRLFDPRVLERLALIALGRSAGFTLDEMAGMFTPDGRPKIDRTRLATRAQELDVTIRQLGALRDGLRHAAVCPAPSHMECPTFRRLLERAARRDRPATSRKERSARARLGVQPRERRPRRHA
jgi:DNA-binding transcriptional MerR regulator